MTMADRIRERLDAVGKTAQEASLEISDNRDLIRDIIKGRSRNPRTDTMRKLASVLETTVEHLMDGDGAPPAPRLPTPLKGNARRADVEMPHRNALLRDIEVLGTVAGSMGGAFQFEGGVVDYVARPPGLMNAKGVYAVYVENSSMEPAHPHGELRFISAHKPVRPGDDVVITVRYFAEGPTESFIKRLVRRSADRITVRQFNPEAELEFEVRFVERVNKVLTMNELFGI